MANKTFDQFTVITSTNDADKVVLWDASASQAAAITVANFLDGILLLNGASAMAANLDMGGFAITNVGNVDGVDVSALSSTVTTLNGTVTTLNSNYTTHAANAAIHRSINDAGSGATDLWSASKIATELASVTVDLSGYVRRSGADTLTGDWDIGNGRYIATDKIRARDGDGLALQDDGGNGVFVEDGGQVGIGTTSPESSLHIFKGSAGTATADVSTALALEHSSDCTVEFITPNGNAAWIVFTKPSGAFNGYIKYTHATSAGNIQFAAAGFGPLYEMNLTHLKPAVDDFLDLGGLTYRWDDIYATNATIQTSDVRDKESLEESDLGLDFIMALEPKRWTWQGKNRPHYGLSAQQVKAAMDELGIADFAGYIHDPEADKHALRYNEFIGPMIAAIHELRGQIAELEETYVGN